MTSTLPHTDAPTRRELLTWFAGLSAWSACVARTARAPVAEDAFRMLVRGDRPENLETPVGAFVSPITPIDHFFVRSHFGPPLVGPHPWKIQIRGLVDRPIELDAATLSKRADQNIEAVLQCAGNGRALFNPIIPGVPWERGAVGNAVWGGVALQNILQETGIQANARHVHVVCADLPPHPKTPAYLRSLPLEKALEPSTLLATTMNGSDLPLLHGGPVRLVVPGWTGNHWMKWVRALVVSDVEAPGFYQQTGYRMPRSPAPPGAVVPADDLLPVTELNVKSLITRPARGELLKPGPQTITGVAWTGAGRVTDVEVSIDGSAWQTATLRDGRDFGWRIWTSDWSATAGRHEIAARARDDRGQVQPEVTPWNKSGYLWNGIDRVNVEVRA